MKIVSVVLFGILCAPAVFSQSIFAAASNGTADDVRAAIRAGGRVNDRAPGMGLTPLMLAGKLNKDPEVIRALVKAGADVNAREHFNSSTALLQAAEYSQNPEVVAALLAAGADPLDRDGAGYNVLMYAAWKNKNPDVMRLILKSGTPIDEADSDGKTPLMHAAYAANAAMIAVLLEEGADGRLKASNGKTAFEFLDVRMKGTDSWDLLDKARQ